MGCGATHSPCSAWAPASMEILLSEQGKAPVVPPGIPAKDPVHRPCGVMLPEKRLIRSWPKGDRPRPVCSGLPAVPRCPPGQFHGGLEPSGARHPLCLPEGGAFLPPDLRHSPGPRLGSPQTPLPRDGTPLPSGPQQPGQGGRLIPLQWAVGQDRPQPCRTFRLFRPLPGLQNRPCLSGSRLPLPLCFDPVFPIPGRLFGPGASLRLRRAFSTGSGCDGVYPSSEK